MSFILDALRKSENERQRNQQPGLAVSQVPQARKGSGIWLPLVALLVGVNLSLLIVMWFMSGTESAVAPAPVAPAAPAAAPATPPPPAVVAPASPGEPPSIVRVMPEPGAEFAAQYGISPEPEPEPTEPAESDSNLPTMEELILGNIVSVPTLNMDIHVYSDVPEERFVFINMSRYNEGQTLKEGPLLLEITDSGVVLRHQGHDFLVTRE